MKMSDVFKLPVSPSLMGDDHIEQLTDCGDAHYCLEDSVYWMASNLEHIEHAAHAINHADALADALESMLEHEKEMAYSVWDYRDGRAAIFEQSEEFAIFNDSFADELAALTAYRGAK